MFLACMLTLHHIFRVLELKQAVLLLVPCLSFMKISTSMVNGKCWKGLYIPSTKTCPIIIAAQTGTIVFTLRVTEF